ncbi:MAG: metalloprotease [Parachlamydia sp.]|nr:MAG: metalloprotease [Parachlamydia sp.]
MTSYQQEFSVVGQKYLDFEVTKVMPIKEINCLLTELVHIPTGAEVLHLGNDDPENMFCLSFRTIPKTSNGVAHILEHIVLCGSKKFPLKDPFMSMTHRSLNTFMNAFTGSDFTCYPAATLLAKDFYNLLDVYIDAVFRPNLTPLSFLQEGHRFDFSEGDKGQSLEFKGVVFNEMKGAMSSPSSRLSEAMSEALFPTLTYGINSGGDPKEIPQLTHEELRQFHQEHYHPSRCLFFFYGNMPLIPHLDFITKNALADSSRKEALPQIPKEKRFTTPKKIEAAYPVSQEESLEKKTMIGHGWLTAHILNQKELLALTILDIVLMDTDASLLKMPLLKSGLCTQVSSSMDAELSEAPYILFFKGCEKESADQILQCLETNLKEIKKRGIPQELIESAIHQVEFHRTEITGNQAPYGLSLYFRSALMKQHGAAPEEGLVIHSLFKELREDLAANPHMLVDLIDRYFLNNPHCATVVMQPSKDLVTAELEEEKEVLRKIQEKLTEEDKQRILEQAKELAAYQELEEDLSILPCVSISDIPKEIQTFPLVQEQVGHLQVFSHPCFTNHIVYTELVFPLPKIAQADLPILRLLTLMMPQLGCGGRSYAENLEYMQAHTGGVDVILSFYHQVHNSKEFVPSLMLRGKSLARKADKLFPLLHDLARTVDFSDVERIKELLAKHYTGLESGLNQNAMKYAINLSSSGLDISGSMSSSMYGLEYYRTIKELATHFDQNAADLIAKLKSLFDQITCLQGPQLVLGCDQEMYDELKAKGFYGLAQIEQKSYTPWDASAYHVPKVSSQGRTITTPVAFTSTMMDTLSYVDPEAPALAIASRLFDNLILHPKLREQGGAYGAGASSNSLAGRFYFFAYRDPNIASSLDAFKEAVDTILKGDFEDSDIDEAKFETIQGMDSPVAPGSRASLAYEWLREGKTSEMRQKFRERLLALTGEDVKQAIKKYIVPKLASATTVVFASRELLEQENALLLKQGKPALPIESV